ncbi:MAG TPA: CHASE3 domain-containing protein [Terriglobales bacterium]|nr:CHASE3 domain-containing protein [Terriglobales bacterium]
MKMIAKIALKVGGIALLALMAWNAWLGVKHLKDTQNTVAVTKEGFAIQAGIAAVLQDLTDMETGQRGFLLTGDPSYLQPYNDAKGRVGTDFSDLRKMLANKEDHASSLLSQIESLTNAKQAEMQRTIDLRERGYRHRAFMLVSSNEGMGYMDSARKLLVSLAAQETSRVVNFDQERTEKLKKASRQTIVVNSCLLLLTACLFALARRHARGLEREAVQNREELAARDLRLTRLTSVLSHQARSKTSTIEENARMLLQTYGGFLPRQGHQWAEEIKEASAQMERLRQDLVATSDGKNGDQAILECVA